MRFRGWQALLLVTAVALVSWSCSGREDKSEAGVTSISSLTGSSAVAALDKKDGPALVLASPSPAATPGPAAPGGIAGPGATPTTPSTSTTPWTSPGLELLQACPLGKGEFETPCDRGNEGQFRPQVEAAVAQVMATHPEYFDTTRKMNESDYYVIREAEYLQAVVNELRAQGFCAQTDPTGEVQVKNQNGFSEQYDVLLSSGFVWRGPGSYRNTCNPANFPVDPLDVFDALRVHFYGIRCLDGRTPPAHAAGILPVGCFGDVTATPKMKDNRDVPAYLLSMDIKWEILQQNDAVDVISYPQLFNKTLVPLQPGGVSVCAELMGKRQCMDLMIVATYP